MQKARGQAGHKAHGPPTARRHGVSGSVSSPGRGSSHRSVALLGSLSVVIECLALREGPRRFRPGFTCPTLLGYQSGGFASVAYGALTRCGRPSQGRSAGVAVCHSAAGPAGRPSVVLQPRARIGPPPTERARFGLFPVRSPLLGEYLVLSSGY